MEETLVSLMEIVKQLDTKLDTMQQPVAQEGGISQ